ncbi:GNAT family N-acetyltransferase [Variovorax soli]|uniref:GNAT superfamily N-acetyltransferase n=1 Tax=Variovorax soli TaxID=376815 RepID=A0ABU1NGP1_9BURK|nr:GNAT family N-acetyltransferase [Variovorax soli]MDR6537523.1 GNAT superfamily N-acetyltransferase [Variovorax soli]
MRDDAVLIPFAKAHLDSALRLSQEMSWPYRLEDWEVALQLGHGFVLQRAGVMIGTAVWWPYGDAHASAGMIIVAKGAQGRGYGARLMDALLAAAHPRAMTLNSTAEGLALYARRGFTPIGAIQQHQGIPNAHHEAPSTRLVRAMAASDFEAIARLDQEATGWARQPMLRRLIERGDGHVLLRDGMPSGYAISRRFGRGHVIGPVVAENPAAARALIEAALAHLGRVFVRVDTASTSQLGPWLEALGLPQVGDATTMVLGSQTQSAGPARVFALANQSFN